MINAIIRERKESGVSWELLTALMHESFQERLEQGLYFTCSFMDAKQFAERTKNGVVLVAMDGNTNEILGTGTVTIKRDKDNIIYGYNEYLAIKPKAKRQGLATKLLEERVSIITQNGGKYVMSDTSINAISSVQWHLKNGFKIYELESYRSTNYWSYVFVKPLTKINKLSPVRVKLHYWKSFIVIKLTRHVDGSDSQLGYYIKALKKRWRN